MPVRVSRDAPFVTPAAVERPLERSDDRLRVGKSRPKSEDGFGRGLTTSLTTFGSSPTTAFGSLCTLTTRHAEPAGFCGRGRRRWSDGVRGTIRTGHRDPSPALHRVTGGVRGFVSARPRALERIIKVRTRPHKHTPRPPRGSRERGSSQARLDGTVPLARAGLLSRLRRIPVGNE